MAANSDLLSSGVIARNKGRKLLLSAAEVLVGCTPLRPKEAKGSASTLPALATVALAR